MRGHLVAWLAAPILVFTGAIAWGATLVTPAIEGGSGSSGVTCTAVNVGGKVKQVRVEIFDDTGTAVAETFGPLDPGAAFTLDHSVAGGPARYCVISFKGGRRSVRGALYVRDDSSVGTVTAQ